MLREQCKKANFAAEKFKGFFTKEEHLEIGEKKKKKNLLNESVEEKKESGREIQSSKPKNVSYDMDLDMDMDKWLCWAEAGKAVFLKLIQQKKKQFRARVL